MRRVLAMLLDVAVVVVGGYLLFRFAENLTPCGISGTCPLLAPLTVVLILILLAVYFGGAFLLWRSTVGERLFMP